MVYTQVSKPTLPAGLQTRTRISRISDPRQRIWPQISRISGPRSLASYRTSYKAISTFSAHSITRPYRTIATMAGGHRPSCNLKLHLRMSLSDRHQALPRTNSHPLVTYISISEMAYKALIGGDILEHQDRQLETQVEIYKINWRVALIAQEARPKNTNRAYETLQKEWKEFCQQHAFIDREIVTELKLVAFLHKSVINRSIQSSWYRKARTDMNGDSIVQTLGRSAIKTYINALVNY